MSRFVANAVSLLDAAENASRAGHTPSDMTILISPEGGIRMIADSDWPPLNPSEQANTSNLLVFQIGQGRAKQLLGLRIFTLTAVRDARHPTCQP